jgi:hypothetical protein
MKIRPISSPIYSGLPSRPFIAEHRSGTRSWTGETHLLRSNHKMMFEYACHEGNYSMRNILEAARANDLNASSATLPAH